MTDNAQCFKSEEIESFLRKNVIKHTTSVQYHPASNSLARRAVQVLKRGVKKVTTGFLKLGCNCSVPTWDNS